MKFLIPAMEAAGVRINSLSTTENEYRDY